MSKKNELATQQGGEIVASQYHRDYKMEGEDNTDSVMPRVILHQGDISEKYYGKQEKGTLLNSVTGEILTARKFHPLGISWKEWIRLGENIGDRIVYRHRNKADVPAADLLWDEDETKKPKDRAPKASLFYNFVVLFEGATEPICLSLKAKSKLQRGAAKALNQMIKIRVARKLDPGLYELDIIDASNDKGKWKDVKIRPIGNPSEDLAALGYQFWMVFSDKSIVVDIDKSDDAEEPDDTGYDPNKDE
jgi:hypothetical protein